MTFDAYYALAIACLFLLLKPGPHMFTMIGLCVAGRWRSALAFWTGYFISSTALYYVLLSTLSLLPTNFGVVFLMLKAIAAMLFIAMGFSGLQQRISEYEAGAEELQERITGISLLSKFGVGTILAVSNPYDILFILTVIPALTGLHSFTLTDIGIVRGIHGLTDFVITSAYCLPILFARNFLNAGLLSKLKTFSSIAMILIGLYIVVNMISQWDLKQGDLILSIG